MPPRLSLLSLLRNPALATLLIALGAGLWWSHGDILPLVMLASLAAALSFVYLLGASLHPLIAGPRQPGVFQLLWLGQYGLFAIAAVLTLLAGLGAVLNLPRIPLNLSLPAIVAGWIFTRRRSRGESEPVLATPSRPSLVLASLASFAVVRATAIHSISAGALGHDTQQHIYWAQTALDYGYLPLTARDTNLLETYPRLWHLLAGSWSGGGLFGEVGSFAKILPTIELVLALGFFCELVLAANPASMNARSLSPVLMGAGLAWHLTFGDGQRVAWYPDMSGTPRFSAEWVLLGLPLLVLAQRIGTIAGAERWLMALVPIFGAIALGINPVDLCYYLAFSVPFTGVLWWLTASSSTARKLAILRPLALGMAVSLLPLAMNSFIVVHLAKSDVGKAVAPLFDLRAEPRGLNADAMDPPLPRPPLCKRDSWIPCGMRVVRSAVEKGVTTYFQGLLRAELPSVVKGAHYLYYWLAAAFPFLALGVAAMRGALDRSCLRERISLFLAIVGTCLISAIFLSMGDALVTKLRNQGDLFRLLHGYFHQHEFALSPSMLCVLSTSSWLLLPSLVVPLSAKSAAALFASAALAFELSRFTPPGVPHRKHEWRIDWPELRAIDELNAFVPRGEAVLIQAAHMHAGREHIVVAIDRAGMIVPHLKTRTLFGIYLGTSAEYGWLDLHQRMCNGTNEDRAALLREANVRWVLVRAKDPASREAYDAYGWACGITLPMLGATYPAAWSKRDLALYRLPNHDAIKPESVPP